MSLPQAVGWLKCVICQKERKEKTQCPANSKRHDAGAGYLTIERDLTSFYEVGELNLVVGWEQWDDGNGIARTLDGHHCAVWHKSCRNSLNKTKLNGTLKRKLLSKSHDQSSSKRTRLYPEGRNVPCAFLQEIGCRGRFKRGLYKGYRFPRELLMN